MPTLRYALEWPNAGGSLQLVEPTLDEVREHAPLLATFYNDPTNRALLTNEHDFDADDVVDQFEEMWSDGERPFLLSVDGTMIGDCDLRNVEADRAEFAILVGPRATQAKGLGTRFTTMALVVAFERLGMKHMFASIRPENAGSLRMFEKVGYVIDTSPEARRYAEEEDDVCVSITATKFHALHASAIDQVRVVVRD
jgi:RimJ/RimL family protein N-acetyltransferase